MNSRYRLHKITCRFNNTTLCVFDHFPFHRVYHYLYLTCFAGICLRWLNMYNNVAVSTDNAFCLGMDGWSSEARFELGAAELVADSVLAQNTYQAAFVSGQKWQNSNKKVICRLFICLFVYLFFFFSVICIYY